MGYQVRFVLFIVSLVLAHQAVAADSCEALKKITIAHVSIVQAVEIPAGSFHAPNGQAYDVPAFCRVQGVSRPTPISNINFEVWLPVTNWNGRYYQVGNGGGSGFLDYTSLATYLRAGNVVANTDDGHNREEELARKNPAGKWGWLLDTEKTIDGDYRALKETRDAAQIILNTYYDKAAHHRYFMGCSGGGLYALTAAEMFPEDWDGILVGAGIAPENTYRSFIQNTWASKRWLENPEGRIPPSKLPLIQKKARASCQPEAHVVDGIAADPRLCSFDPASLSCQGEDGDDCLTAAQVETLQMLYDGPRNPRTGELIAPGYTPSMEAAADGLGGWDSFVTGGAKALISSQHGGSPYLLDVAQGWMRTRIFKDVNWSLSQFDFDRDTVLVKQVMAAAYTNAENRYLARQRKKGSKIIRYMGWGDVAQIPEMVVEHYETVAQHNGGLENTQDFFRLFMVPGMLHCHSGPGANAFGQVYTPTTPALKNDREHHVLRALEAWVEEGLTPEKLIAAKYIDNDAEQGAAFTRPLCPILKLQNIKVLAARI